MRNTYLAWLLLSPSTTIPAFALVHCPLSIRESTKNSPGSYANWNELAGAMSFPQNNCHCVRCIMNASTQVDSEATESAFIRIDQVIKTGHQTVSQSSRVQCLDNSLGHRAGLLHAYCVYCGCARVCVRLHCSQVYFTGILESMASCLSCLNSYGHSSGLAQICST